MKGKILLVVGLAVGYVLGTRAGREKYEEIKKNANKLWNDPRVQRQVENAEDFVKDKAPEVAEFLADGAKKVVGQVAGKKPATRSTASKPAAASSGTRSTSTKSTSAKTTPAK
ncbi:MAG: YtxH domain-containing protein [Microbacteriaceae bacterium]